MEIIVNIYLATSDSLRHAESDIFYVRATNYVPQSRVLCHGATVGTGTPLQGKSFLNIMLEDSPREPLIFSFLNMNR